MHLSFVRPGPDPAEEAQGPIMLPQFAEHAPYIYAAYGLAALTMGGLIAGIVLRARAARAKLERLQRQSEPGPEQ